MSRTAIARVTPPRRAAASRPESRLWRVWNWKAAVLSALTRASIFFAANASAGVRVATGAFAAELVYRACTAGFYGAMTQTLAQARPVWAATIAALIAIPAAAHAGEFAVHYLRGTPELARSITASIAFTVVSTLFNLFAMRHGAFIVGGGEAPLLDDLRRLPRLVRDFLWWPFR